VCKQALRGVCATRLNATRLIEEGFGVGVDGAYGHDRSGDAGGRDAGCVCGGCSRGGCFQLGIVEVGHSVRWRARG
jgi:hypothetical protein